MESKYSYNSWPLGKLPKSWRRPEPDLIRKSGYLWEDPRDINDLFEEKLAQFAGSKFCVTTDCASNAMFLCLQLDQVRGRISIPRQTYISVLMQLIHSGCEVELRDEEWTGLYRLEGTRIIDGAGRFRPGMYEHPGALHILSFQIKKRLPIGRGGAILTDDYDAYEWLKLARYDGRDLSTEYTSINHIKMAGWHYYMTPEDAARGILLMDSLSEDYSDVTSYQNYPPLDQFEAVKKMTDKVISKESD